MAEDRSSTEGRLDTTAGRVDETRMRDSIELPLLDNTVLGAISKPGHVLRCGREAHMLPIPTIKQGVGLKPAQASLKLRKSCPESRRNADADGSTQPYWGKPEKGTRRYMWPHRDEALLVAAVEKNNSSSWQKTIKKHLHSLLAVFRSPAFLTNLPLSSLTQNTAPSLKAPPPLTGRLLPRVGS